MVTLITERELDDFRREHLAPEALLKLIERFVAVLAHIAVGVGKSWAVDALLQHAPIFRRFDLVIYAAPTWDILNERRIIAQLDSPLVPHLIVRPRPRTRCGNLDGPWEDLEKRGCAAYAKATLCESCPHAGDPVDPCCWPKQLRDIEGTGLVFTTEHQLLTNRSFVPFLGMRTKAKRVLVVLDEARLLDARFETRLSFEDLDRLVNAVRGAARDEDKLEDAAQIVPDLVHALRFKSLGRLPIEAGRLSHALNRYARKIQEFGIDRFGDAFRYVGYEVALLPWSQPEERWRGDDGVRFIARPYLHCHVLVLSAHLTSAYVGHRLGRTAIESPYEHHRFQHTGTRIFNLRSRTGADRYFKKNARSILDTFAVAIVRNIDAGRSSVLVSRKKSKAFCAGYLSKRLAGWGYAVQFMTDGDADLPPQPDPRTIPIIHYGVLGVNDYTEYDSVYCLNSYYINSRDFAKSVLEFDPELVQVGLEITSGRERLRRVRVTNGRQSRAAIESIATDYLHRLELDPALQAIGRVRFATKPREVVIFQMADLARELPGCQDVATPTALREALGMPDAADLDREYAVTHAQRRMTEGARAAEVAAELGLSRRTLFRRLKEAQSAKTPLRRSSCRRFGTPVVPPPSADGGGT